MLLVLTDEASSKPLVEGSNPWVINRLQFKADYVGYLNRLRDHIYTFDLEAGILTQLTFGDYDDADPDWSPDGKQIAFASNRTADPDSNSNSDIWIVAAHDQDMSKTLQRVTTNPGADTRPIWHPDGKSLAYISVKPDVEYNYGVTHLARTDLMVELTSDQADLSSRYLTDQLDRNIIRPRFTANGKSLYFIIEDSAEQHLAKLDWKTERVKRVIDDALRVSDFAFDKNGNVAVVISTSTHPAELSVVRRGKRQVLTHVNDSLMLVLRLGRTEEIHFKAPDGWDIEGFVTYPPDYQPGIHYPVVLRIHGGPVSQYDHGFSFDAQLLAAQGYIVVRANPRGSSGYGQAFTLGLYQGWGEKDYQDVLAAVDYVIAQGDGDPDGLAVGGYSYGGILTNYLLGQTTRFKAAVSGAGSGLYVASYGHDEYQHWYESELGTPWENRALWERLSPFNYIHKATTPTLFMGGAKDWNVPIQGSEQLYQVMKRVGIDTELVVYPDEHHGGWAFANNKDYWLRTLAWYERYLKLPVAALIEEPVAAQIEVADPAAEKVRN